jgi:UPF0176 protein
MQIKNIAGYKFVPLADLPLLQTALLAETERLQCKGTILLSAEGINLSLAASADAIVAFQAYLEQDVRFAGMAFRESESAYQPFKFMRVKIRDEIITMRQPDVKPRERAPSLSPQEFKQWLDENRDITVLDTRNDFEVRFGTFARAEHFQLAEFGEFPKAALNLQKDKPVVMFCTGGIRCEKAAVYMLNAGFPEVYQLDGGILNYFSEVGGAHYRGECFVFDQRVSVDAALQETGTLQCTVCQSPVSREAQASSDFVPGVSCSQCVKTRCA